MEDNHESSTTVDLNCALIPSEKPNCLTSHKKQEFNNNSPFGQSPASSTNSRKSFQFCRICHDGDGTGNGSPNSTTSLREPLIAPCKCTGTVALIHLSCLEHWLTSSNTDRCEICQYAYKISRVPRTCNDYLWDRNNQFNVRNLIADIICFMLLTPLLVVSTYLCVLGANQYFIKERWEAAGLIILSMFLLGVYFTWCHVTIRYHSSVWRSWQRNNQQIRLDFMTEDV